MISRWSCVCGCRAHHIHAQRVCDRGKGRKNKFSPNFLSFTRVCVYAPARIGQAGTNLCERAMYVNIKSGVCVC